MVVGGGSVAPAGLRPAPAVVPAAGRQQQRQRQQRAIRGWAGSDPVAEQRDPTPCPTSISDSSSTHGVDLLPSGRHYRLRSREGNGSIARKRLLYSSVSVRAS
ncbi:hypothetical protein C1924_03015 [Stenotrophomonas sp. ESTM1D_MKCIP4_1]|nr:hypothetical protein C1924_03015 [Stenotrophomonas sp. ESTM1D_MKCIP4_1]